MDNNKRTRQREGASSQTPRRVRREQSNNLQNAMGQQTPRRPIFQADQAAPPKKPFAWRVWARRVVILALIGFFFWLIVLSHTFDVRGFEVRNSTSVSEADIQKVYSAYLKQHPYERNFLFFNDRQFAQAITATYPTVSRANINRTLFFRVVVSVSEANAALIWQVGNSNWVLGDDGRVLALASGAEKRLGVVRDTAQLQVRAGDKVADRTFVRFVREIYSLAPQNNITIESVEVSNATSEVVLRLPNNIIVRCDTTRGASEQIEAVKKTFETAEKTRIPITQYIDARIPGKTYYK